MDLISTEFAAGVIAATLGAPAQSGRIVHASAGTAAPRLDELLKCLGAYFSRHHRGWASGAVSSPDVVDRETFALFEKSVHQSGDLLFQRVCDDAQSFLPILLYPRTMVTSLARSIPSGDWLERSLRRVAALAHRRPIGTANRFRHPMTTIGAHPRVLPRATFAASLLSYINTDLPRLDRRGPGVEPGRIANDDRSSKAADSTACPSCISSRPWRI